jgi:argininosuccinate lyase
MLKPKLEETSKTDHIHPKCSQEGVSTVGDADLEDFLASIHFDKRLYKHDIQGSVAHVKMLVKQGILDGGDGEKIIQGLQEIHEEIEQGKFHFDPSLEDIHMNIEAALEEKIGDIGGAVHTARSRNDQVALDLRLYIRDEIDGILELIDSLQISIQNLANENDSVIIPGYTHLQQAQPVSLSQHLLAHYHKLQRDKERFQDCYKRVNVNPLGACALAGTTHPIDPNYTTELLGMEKPMENTLDAVSDRDFVVETAFCSSLCMTHLSGICEELILWSTSEFGFIKFQDGLTTGSSIMPQKKNPDVAELVRGKTGRVNGNLVALLTMLKGLPLAYNKDLQEDKEAIFDSLDTLKGSLEAITKLLGGTVFIIDEVDVINTSQNNFANATELADHLTQKGVPFRTAYNITKEVVAYCVENGKTLNQLTLEEFKQFCDKIEQDVYNMVDIGSAVDLKSA